MKNGTILLENSFTSKRSNILNIPMEFIASTQSVERIYRIVLFAECRVRVGVNLGKGATDSWK